MKYQIILLLVFVSLIMIPSINAQLLLGGEANQKGIEVTVDRSEIIHVKHTVYSSSSPGNVEIFVGMVEESLKVTNEEGEEIEFGKNGNDDEGITGILILPSNKNSIIEYNVKGASELNDKLWTVKIEYFETFSVLFSEEINLVFVNNNLIELGDQKGISVNGGGNLNLQYYSNLPKMIKEIEWEENKFNVEIITELKIDKFNFEQTTKSINFKVNEKNKLISLIMEEELLGGPYVVLLNDEKIQYTQLNKNDNQVVLTMKPESVGQITIIGTTVIPEFSMFIPLIMGFLVVLTVPFMKKFNLH